MVVCRTHSISSDQYVDPFYSCGELFGIYRPSFHPVTDEKNWMPWDGPEVLPNLNKKRKGGRPVSSRIHNEMDHRSTVTCSLCGVEGHKKRSCPRKTSTSGPSG
ncbi:hypothetical protein RND81_10G192800 [Saponaria officinalis]|uniref:CCHC-type domain-containing protein n=1 Tax=Saponaria officinalis TaxID=3572 RepID=A0AAW1I6H1_SAPOF